MRPCLWADFNNARPDGSIRTTARYAETPETLAHGMVVVLRDDEGNTVRARVTTIDGLAVELVADWPTWADAPALGGEA